MDQKYKMCLFLFDSKLTNKIIILALKLKLASDGFTRVLAVDFNRYLRGFDMYTILGVGRGSVPKWHMVWSVLSGRVCVLQCQSSRSFVCLPVGNINILICCPTLWNPDQNGGTRKVSLSTPTPPSVPLPLPICWRFLLLTTFDLRIVTQW